MISNRNPPTQTSVLELLKRRETYPDRPGSVDVVETHISWVFLTDRYAYKLKKPVRFEFLDFSSPEARRQACFDEVGLNRRMAPDVYVRVLPIVASPGSARPRLGGEGTPIDWVVQMRRLPADRTLQHLLERGTLRAEEKDKVASMLGRFYAQAAPLIVTPDEYHREIQRHVRANLAELMRPSHLTPKNLVRRAHSAQLRFLELTSHVLADRVCDGRIVDGHGDLRPEHIYLMTNPVVIDCVEFSSELRTVDAVDDLCFLAMECDAIGTGGNQLGQQIILKYCQISGDRPPEALLSFYKCYRACVRAKVMALRAEQVSAQDRGELLPLRDQYLRLAGDYAAEMGPPLGIIVGGLMGTGKSTLATELSNRLGLELLNSDTIRRELFGPSPLPAEYGDGRYRPHRRAQVYKEMLARTRRLLADGVSVVLDASFLTSEIRASAVEMVRQAGATPLMVRCRCPRQVARQRIADRRARGDSASEARPELLAEQERDEEPDPPGLESLFIDTRGSLNGQVGEVFKELSGRIVHHLSC